MKERDAVAVADWFAPESPGGLVHAHIVQTGIGRCRVDRWPGPSTVLAELPGGNVAARGEPRVVADLAGFVQAEPEWLPVLREVDPDTAVWPRLVAVLPDPVDLPAPAHAVRRLGPDDADALARLDASIGWVWGTWGGPAGLAASGTAWAAFDGPRLVSLACSFFLGRDYEDIGVVTDPHHRGHGLASACATALVGEIRARGRRPTWTTSPDNAASLSISARLGFVRVREDALYAVHTPIPS
ncbi:GNAT family N-acetyltransferase [Pseudonocardia hispaniensis]|uniref:GNAT family N-acetyltransferase n=1 Tax=Pseudonocardia hispaniensis TaxID=904933 RepID=A0ABW1J1I4_9PSEU